MPCIPPPHRVHPEAREQQAHRLHVLGRLIMLSHAGASLCGGWQSPGAQSRQHPAQEQKTTRWFLGMGFAPRPRYERRGCLASPSGRPPQVEPTRQGFALFGSVLTAYLVAPRKRTVSKEEKNEQDSRGDSPEFPVDDIRRALDLCPAVAGAPGVDYELDVPAPELALRRVSGKSIGRWRAAAMIPRCIRTCQVSRRRRFFEPRVRLQVLDSRVRLTSSAGESTAEC